MPNTSTSSLTLTLLSDTEIRMTRQFRAPRALVFEAHTKVEHLRRWWGPRNTTLTVCDVDLRVGGQWRYVCREESGAEFGFRGEYREIDPVQRLAYTFEFEGMPGHICLETLEFEEAGGVTTLIDTTTFDSKEDRDGMLESGMEEGANESMDRLSELIDELTR